MEGSFFDFPANQRTDSNIYSRNNNNVHPADFDKALLRQRPQSEKRGFPKLDKHPKKGANKRI